MKLINLAIFFTAVLLGSSAFAEKMILRAEFVPNSYSGFYPLNKTETLEIDDFDKCLHSSCEFELNFSGSTYVKNSPIIKAGLVGDVFTGKQVLSLKLVSITGDVLASSSNTATNVKDSELFLDSVTREGIFRVFLNLK